MAEFPALPLWTDAYLGDTTHLTTIEHGAYLLLLIVSWRTSECRLPDDDRLLARYARCTATQWRRLRPVLAEFFDIRDGFWTQSRLTDEALAVKQKKDKAAQAGRASALKRKGRHATKRQPKPNEASTKAQQGADLTNNHIEETKTKVLAKKTLCRLPDDWIPAPFGDGTEAAAIVSDWPPGEEARQLERFADHHRLRGNRYADWQAAWGTWVRNSVRFGPKRANGGSDRNFEDVVLAEYGAEAAT